VNMLHAKYERPDRDTGCRLADVLAAKNERQEGLLPPEGHLRYQNYELLVPIEYLGCDIRYSR
jgi:hypothetical protein